MRDFLAAPRTVRLRWEPARTYQLLTKAAERIWVAVVQAGLAKFGALHVLANNAGICPMRRLENVSEEVHRRVIDINQVGVFLGMKTAVWAMRESGGSIINIASTAAPVGFEDNFVYVASKWAIRGMTRAAALDLAEFGIRVNTVVQLKRIRRC